MLYLILISFLLNSIFYLWLKKKLKENLSRIQLDRYQRLNRELEFLKKNESFISKRIDELKNTLEEEVQLYQINKQMYKFLEEDRIFAVFKDRLFEVVNFKDCLFLKRANLDIDLNREDLIFELKTDSTTYGFLILKGKFSFQQKERFYIMAQQFLLALKRAKLYEKVEMLSITDSLTSLYNRRYFLERLKQEIERSGKFGLNFSFIMIDIDNFKNCNDQFGHLVGDYVLKEVAKTIKDNIRHIDLASRYGGEEFCILLPQTDREGAFFAGERIRKELENKPIKAYDDELKVTVSMGISYFPEDGKVETEIIEKADIALYTAKTKGKNQVCIYSPSK